MADGPLRGPGAEVDLDPGQRAVVEAVLAGADSALLVLGAPGSGKTTVALESVVAAGAAGLSPDEVLVLTASRRLAADLRERLAARWRHTGARPLAQTPAAVAFAVLRARANALGEPVPVLVSGAEQDRALAELLAGHAAGEGAEVGWPEVIGSDTRRLRAFRDELRDLLMRAAERGLDPAGLARLGRARGRPEWVAAARVYREYLEVTALGAGTPDLGARLDPAVVVDEAVEALIAWEDEVPRLPRPRWRLVVVDDHQETTAATARLLQVLAADGARLLLLADPDAAVQTFRGADPSLVARAAVAGDGPGAFGARVLTLPTVWRHGPAVRAVVRRVTERIGTVGAVAQRQADAVGAGTSAGTSAGTGSGAGAGTGAGAGAEPVVAVLPSPAQEAAFVAHTLRRARLERGLTWDDMAVVARSGTRVTELRRSLAAAGVPVSVLGSQVPLREEPAVRPLLTALRVCAGTVVLDAELAVELGCSPLGGLDALGLRRARRALRAAELAGGGGRASGALLVEALTEPSRLAGLAPEAARRLRRLAGVLAAGHRAAGEPGADAHGVLWAVWDAAGLAEPWRRAALAGGPGGQRADRDLDAVLALFRAAETFVERMAQAPPVAFVEWLSAQDLPADSLAARGRSSAVPVLTAAGAAGREWELVVVAGVQEGVWPDLRLRDTLLGSQALVDVLDGRVPVDVGGAGGAGVEEVDLRAARSAVLSDELRTFAVACSRARTTLVVTAVADTDHTPSPFVDLVVAGPEESDVPDPRAVVAPAPLDLRGLVATLRRRIEASDTADDEPDAAAVRTLAALAAAGVAGADPAEWQGLAQPSTDEPLWPADVRVPVSPSRIETARACALRWAFEAAGGSAGGSVQQTLGTLVHSIAQQHPTGTREELMAALDARWGELGLGAGWPAASTRRRAEAMVSRLAEYVRTAGPPVLVEAPFVVLTERAQVRGTADRVELVAGADVGGAPGSVRVRVVDLKTGANPPTAADAEVNPQLGAYQLAVTEAAFDGLPDGATSAEARLVFLGAGATGPLVRRQPGLVADEDGSSWARAMVDEVAEAMAASSFAATGGTGCDRCPVRRSCPLRPEGGQVVA